MRVIVLHLALLALPAFAAGLSEDEAVQLGLSQPRVATLLESRRAAAEGAADAAGRWHNPEVEISEESLDLPGGDSTDRFMWVRQRFNVAGARGLERAAARHSLEGDYARVELERRELAREIRGLYYDVVAARRRLDALDGWRARLEQLVGSVEARRQAGDVARYDALRLRQELALVNARVLEARAAAESAREALFELIGSRPADLTGGLLPPPASADAAGPLQGHPTLLALEADADGAETRARAARRDAWPDVTLGVGRREFEEGGIDADGGLIAIGVEVPLFDRNQGAARAADHESRALRAQASLARSRLQAQAREALRLLEARRAAVLELKRGSAGAHDSLPAIAEAAYDAGEIDVMALIDAHRTELAVANEITALARAARTAYIQLQYLSNI